VTSPGRDIEQLFPSGAVQLRRAKGHAEAAAPQNDIADSRGVGVAGYGVVGVTVVGAQRPEIDARAAAKTTETGYRHSLLVHH
jgi:hypothetical protein